MLFPRHFLLNLFSRRFPPVLRSVLHPSSGAIVIKQNNKQKTKKQRGGGERKKERKKKKHNETNKKTKKSKSLHTVTFLQTPVLVMIPKLHGFLTPLTQIPLLSDLCRLLTLTSPAGKVSQRRKIKVSVSCLYGQVRHTWETAVPMQQTYPQPWRRNARHCC